MKCKPRRAYLPVRSSNKAKDTAVIAVRYFSLLAFGVEDPPGTVGRRCRRPTFRSFQSMLKTQLSLLAVDLEDLPFTVGSRCLFYTLAYFVQ